MEKTLKSLENKLDEILKNQEKIIEKLDKSIIIPASGSVSKYSTNKKKNKEDRVSQISRMLEEDFALKPHKIRIQRQFNLLVQPHNTRVKAYLKTNNASIFDGLKRKL